MLGGHGSLTAALVGKLTVASDYVECKRIDVCRVISDLCRKTLSG